MKDVKRCPWCGTDEIYVQYHDTEWGVHVTDDKKLFEFLILEGAQAGLSWLTILKRREGYQKLFADFDAEKVAKFSVAKIEKILLDPSIIRNRLKVYSAVTNAQKFLEVQKEFGSFYKYSMQFVGNKIIKNKWKSLSELPARTPQSDAFSKDLKKRGFKFVGSTIMYAHMQAVGMVDDHLVSCFKH